MIVSKFKCYGPIRILAPELEVSIVKEAEKQERMGTSSQWELRCEQGTWNL